MPLSNLLQTNSGMMELEQLLFRSDGDIHTLDSGEDPIWGRGHVCVFLQEKYKAWWLPEHSVRCIKQRKTKPKTVGACTSQTKNCGSLHKPVWVKHAEPVFLTLDAIESTVRERKAMGSRVPVSQQANYINFPEPWIFILEPTTNSSPFAKTWDTELT